MTPNYTDPMVSCGVCHAQLKDDEVRFLWTDTDWLYHAGHRVWVPRDQEQSYYALARDLSKEATKA